MSISQLVYRCHHCSAPFDTVRGQHIHEAIVHGDRARGCRGGHHDPDAQLFSLRIDGDLYQRLSTEAEWRGVSRAQVIRMSLRRYLPSVTREDEQ